jgi:hypothetical protein
LVLTHLPMGEKSRGNKREWANKGGMPTSKGNGTHSQAILNFRLAVGSAAA